MSSEKETGGASKPSVDDLLDRSTKHVTGPISREGFDPDIFDDAVEGGGYEGGHRRLDVRKLLEGGDAKAPKDAE